MGDIYPLGIAYTLNPAADVKGLYSELPEPSKVFINDKRDKISKNNDFNVTKKKNTAMEMEKIVSELKELLTEKKFSNEAVASMTDTFSNAIRERDEQYRNDLAESKSQKEVIEKDFNTLKSSVTDLEEKLGAANERISVFENDKRAEDAVSAFNHRMDELDQRFDLDEQDREFLAKELKEVGDQEAYAAFSDKLTVLWKHKDKETQAAFNAEIEARIDDEVAKRITKASAEPVEVEAALDAAEPTDPDISNANEAVSSQEPSLRDKFKEAFKRENIEIS